MLATREQADEVEIAVLDFADAFWHAPLAFVERRYFVGTVGGRYYGFARAAQGSKNGPLAWAAFVALAVRLAQGLFSPQGDSRRSPEPLRLEVYVDDPAIVMRGSPAERPQPCITRPGLASARFRSGLQEGAEGLSRHLDRMFVPGVEGLGHRRVVCRQDR